MQRYRLGISLIGMAGPGSGAWTRFANLLPALLRQPSGPDISILVDSSDYEAALRTLGAGAPPFRVVRVARTSRLKRLLGLKQILIDFVASQRLNLLSLEAPPVPTGITVPVVLTLHDLRAFHGALSRRMPTAEEINMRLLLPRHARRADAVVAVSRWTADDITARLGVAATRVAVVPNSVPPIGPASHEPERGNYVLALGHLERRKNLGVVVDATNHSDWPPGVALVLAGKDHGEMRDLTKRMAPGAHRILGPVTDSERDRLLAQTLAVVVPSTVEGFGYSAVEGIRAGAPALVADRAALPETVGTPSACLPADDSAAWARAIALIAADSDHRGRLLAEQQSGLVRFAPERVASTLVAEHRRILSGGSS